MLLYQTSKEQKFTKPKHYSRWLPPGGLIMKWLITFHRDQEAATAVEYAVMLSLILMAVFATVAALGSNLNSKFGNIESQIQAAE
jgi:Flp pilus assembly pilin Flp